MKETLIKFKTAKLAKEKGFNWKTEKGLFEIIDNREVDLWMDALDGSEQKYLGALPTQSILQKWLREIHDIHITIPPNLNDKKGKEKYFPEITTYSYTTKPDLYGIQTIIPNRYNVEWYNTYEEALEYGLLESLKLIKS